MDISYGPRILCSIYILFSGYFLWTQDNRGNIIAELGNVSVTVVAKELGKRWGMLDQETKMDYEAKGRVEKEKYIIAMQKYNQTQPEEQISTVIKNHLF